MTSSRSLFQGSKSSLSVSLFVFSSSFSVSSLLFPSFLSPASSSYRHHHRRPLRYLNLHHFLSHSPRHTFLFFVPSPLPRLKSLSLLLRHEIIWDNHCLISISVELTAKCSLTELTKMCYYHAVVNR